MRNDASIDMISIAEATALVNRRSPIQVKHNTLRSRLKKLHRKSGGRLLVDLSETGATRKLWVRLDVLEEFFPRTGQEKDEPQEDTDDAPPPQEDQVASAHRRIDQLVVRTTNHAKSIREIRREQEQQNNVLMIVSEAAGVNQRLADAVSRLIGRAEPA